MNIDIRNTGKRIFALFFCAVLMHCCGGQTIISGNVFSDDKVPVAFATITIETQDSAVVGYGLTNNRGAYKITFTSSSDSLLVRLKHVNYAAPGIAISNQSQTCNIAAYSDAKTLTEVVVKSPPITQRGDTINYRLDDFASQQDRTLADVLKKLPGVEVDAGGRIKFQGNYINKFYVEGKDLMEGGYGMITNALPNRDAGTVQVLQNHQPVKILEDKIYSPYAAVNIKLKSNVSYTGRAELSAGFAPFIRNIKITPILFTKKQQMLVSYRHNNTGENMYNDLNTTPMMGVYEGISVSSYPEQWLTAARVSLPMLPEKRYLKNNDHGLSLNYLTAVKAPWELRTMLNLLSSRFYTEGSEYTQSIVPNAANNNKDTISYSRHSKYTSPTKVLNFRVSLTNNSKNLFLRNTFSFKTEQNNNDGYIDIQNLPVTQKIEAPYTSFQNSFSNIIPFGKGKKYALNILSFINYEQNKQRYQTTPLTGLLFEDADIQTATKLEQELQLNKFNTDNSFSFSVTRNKITFTPKIGFKWSKEDLKTMLKSADNNNVQQSHTDPRWINGVKYISLKNQAVLNIDYVDKKIKLGLMLPANYYFIQSVFPAQSDKHELANLFFEPFINAAYKLNRYWEINFNANRNYTFTPLREIYTGYIFSSLNFSANDNRISHALSHSVSPGFSYKNPFTNVFLYGSFNYSHTLHNSMLQLELLPNGQQKNMKTERQNENTMRSAQAGIGKFFPKASANLSLKAAVNKMQGQILLNDSISSRTTYGTDISVSLISTFFKWVNVDYTTRLSFSTMRAAGFSSRSSVYSHTAKLFFYLFKENSILFSNEIRKYKMSNNKYVNNFIDIAYQYSIEKAKLDLEIKWVNVLNQKTYTQTFVSDIASTITTFQIRPSQMLFTAKFNLR